MSSRPILAPTPLSPSARARAGRRHTLVVLTAALSAPSVVFAQAAEGASGGASPRMTPSMPPQSGSSSVASAAPAKGWTSASMRFKGYLGPESSATPMHVAWARYTFEVLDGKRYRVDLKIYSALVDLHYESEGLIDAAGLRPRLYRETRRTGTRSPRTRELVFADTETAGQRVLPPGTQDKLSVIAQLSWLARTQPRMWANPGQASLRLAHWDSVDTAAITIGEGRTVTIENGVSVKARAYQCPIEGGDAALEFWLIDDAQRSLAIISFAVGGKRLRFVRIVD